MLSRNNSVQSNLSEAAAATALKRASTLSASQQDLHSQQPHQRRPSSSSLSGRPVLRRRSSSMSERSFRQKSPEEAARERSGQATPEREKPKRRGSFSLPMSLRSSDSHGKKDKGVHPGMVEHLQRKGRPTSPTPLHKKFRASIREGEKTTTKTDRELVRPISPPSHSAVNLPHIPGIGSSASSIRSFQTDLSSIAEDSPFDNAHPLPKMPPIHLYPIKSAMKGGSGPPSIISEAVSEDSKSSQGAHDSKRASKGRVSFSDEQKREQEEANREITHDGTGVGKVDSTATKKANAPAEWSVGTDGYLNPAAAGGAVGASRSVSAPASPPISPPVSPQVLATGPEQLAPKVLPLVSVTSMPTPPQSQSTAPSHSPIVPTETPLVVINGPAQPFQPAPIPPEPPKPNIPSQPTPHEPHRPPGVGSTPITIRVSPTPRVPQRQTRLPGAFPDPTPEPTPPSTAESAATAEDAGGMSDALAPSPASPRSPRLVNDVNELDVQGGLSMGILALVPEAAASLTSEVMVRSPSNESADSGTSVYSDAMDTPIVTPEAKESSVVITAAATTIQTTKPPATTAQATTTQSITQATRTQTTTQATQAKPPAKTKKPKVNGESSKAAHLTIATSAAAYLTAAHEVPSHTTAKKPDSVKYIPPTQGISTPRAPGSMRTSLREDGPSTLRSPARTTLISSPVLPLSPSPTSPPREKKVFRTSMRNNAQPNEATKSAQGLMGLSVLERVPSDSSFKRLKPRESSVIRTTLRDPKPEVHHLRRRNSDSSSEVRVGHHRRRSSSLFARFKRKDSIDHVPVAARVAPGSRFGDSDDDEELPLPGRGIGHAYEDTESLPSPRLRKRSSITNFFWTRSRKGDDVWQLDPPEVSSGDLGHRRSSSGSNIVSQKTGKEKKFQGLRKLFRIRE